MRASRKQVSGTVPARILLKQNRRRFSLRLLPCRRLPAVVLLKTATAEASVAAAAVVAGVATDEVMGVIAARSLVSRGLRAKVFLDRPLLILRFHHVRRNQA